MWILIVSVVSGWHGTLLHDVSKPMTQIECATAQSNAKVQRPADSDATVLIYCKKV
ncbi:hypothetical protein NH8B_0595 [Pseudogulbenkiania sp. NH8B]|nr:hypothetical protein NH8B_0595 [Pseudogulbenkiania sp. NH8B]